MKITKVLQNRYYEATKEEKAVIYENEIAPYIKANEGSAKIRTLNEIDYYTGITTLKEKFEFIPKKYLKGSEMTYIPHAQVFANNYSNKGIPFGSYITWTHDGQDWYISDVGRCICNLAHLWRGSLSESAEKAVINSINCGDFLK